MGTLFTVGLPILTLFIYVFVGFVLRKSNLMSQEASAIVSKLIVNLVVPCLIVNTFQAHFTWTNIKENYFLLIASLVWIVIIYFVSIFVAKWFSKDYYEQYIYRYAISLSNFGGVSYPLVLAFYGEEMLFLFMLFTLPLNLFAYTEGYRILTDNRKINLKFLINPVTISSIIGIIVGLLQIRFPAFIADIMQSFGNMNAPLSMLTVGLAIGGYKLKDLFQDLHAYLISAIRLIVIPALVFFVLWIMQAPTTLLICSVMLLIAPIGMNSIVFPRMLNRDCLLGAKMVTVSTVFSLFTIFGFILLLGLI